MHARLIKWIFRLVHFRQQVVREPWVDFYPAMLSPRMLHEQGSTGAESHWGEYDDRAALSPRVQRAGGISDLCSLTAGARYATPILFDAQILGGLDQ